MCPARDLRSSVFLFAMRFSCLTEVAKTKVCRPVATKHFDPGMNGVDWNALARDRRDQILACADAEVFEKEVHKLVAELKTSHTGFRHAGMRNIRLR
jgi:hypothetical protein